MKKSFSSTESYIASNQLIEAVNASTLLEKPLLSKVSSVLEKQD